MRHNHRPHGVVAMYQLGATETFIEEYLEGMNINQVAYNPEEPLTEELEIDYIKVCHLDISIYRRGTLMKLKIVLREYFINLTPTVSL